MVLDMGPIFYSVALYLYLSLYHVVFITIGPEI